MSFPTSGRLAVPSASDPDAAAAQVPHVITRDKLLDGSLAEHFRANAPPGYHVRSQAELDASLDEVLTGHVQGEPVWVFGYGSLIWNPALAHDAAEKAHVFGWCRRFCIKMMMGRGSVEQPGLMLGLDRGGSCWGVALRVPAEHTRDELALLWRREMLSGAYQARWVAASIHGRRQPALSFVANRYSPRYLGALSLQEQAQMLRAGTGHLGSCRDYFDNTLASLQRLGLKDASLQRLARELGTTPAVRTRGRNRVSGEGGS